MKKLIIPLIFQVVILVTFSEVSSENLSQCEVGFYVSIEGSVFFVCPEAFSTSQFVLNYNTILEQEIVPIEGLRMSPDGTQFIFAGTKSNNGVVEKSARSDLYMYDPFNGIASILLDTSELAEYSPQWSPDGRYIAYCAHATDDQYLNHIDIYVVDIANLQVTRLVQLEELESNFGMTLELDCQLSWFPNSQSIAFQTVFSQLPTPIPSCLPSCVHSAFAVTIDGTQVRELTPIGVSIDRLGNIQDNFLYYVDAHSPTGEDATINRFNLETGLTEQLFSLLDMGLLKSGDNSIAEIKYFDVSPSGIVGFITERFPGYEENLYFYNMETKEIILTYPISTQSLIPLYWGIRPANPET